MINLSAQAKIYRGRTDIFQAPLACSADCATQKPAQSRVLPRVLQRGFTLIELMVVLVVIGILISVAYPAYTQYVARGKRQAVKNMLYAIADRQELFFQDNKAYATDLSDIGYSAEKIGLDSNGQITTATDSHRTYILELVDASATAFTVRGTPQLHQADSDSKCGTLTLTSIGVRGQSGSATNCW